MGGRWHREGGGGGGGGGGGVNLVKRRVLRSWDGDVTAKGVGRRYHYVEKPFLNVSKISSCEGSGHRCPDSGS